MPRTLEGWRNPGPGWQDEVEVWDLARDSLRMAGIDLWHLRVPYQVPNPNRVPLSSGFAYITPSRSEEWASRLRTFNTHVSPYQSLRATCLKRAAQNAINHGGTCSDGHDVVVRVIVVADEGREHLRILRKLSQGTISLLTNNHVVPLWREVHLEDTTFAIFPFIGHRVRDCYGYWAKNSVGDILDMLLQALEVRSSI